MSKHLAFCTSLMALTSLWHSPTNAAVGVVNGDWYACRSIEEHETFFNGLEQGRYVPKPSGCIDIRRGNRIEGPIDSASFTTNKGEDFDFVLAELPGKGKYWVWAEGVEFDNNETALGAPSNSVAESDLWFARLLREKFGRSLPTNGLRVSLDDVPTLGQDIVRIQPSASISGSALWITGSVRTGAIPDAFKTINDRYMVTLDAYMFNRQGELVWHQSGMPRQSWFSASGATDEFQLVRDFSGPLSGNELLIVAWGDPILGEMSESRTILGAKLIKP